MSDLEYRVCWAAWSNASFGGCTDWMEAGRGETEDDVLKVLSDGAGALCEGLEVALEASGFEWRVETRPRAATPPETGQGC